MFDSSTLISWLHHVAVAVRAVADSNFVTAVVGSLAGAFGGAWAAQRIAESSKLREELVKEIRNTNAAASMLYGIANAHLGLKQQFVKPMHDAYFDGLNRHTLFERAIEAGTVPPQQRFDIKFDLQSLKPPYSPTEAIQQLMFNQISLTGAAPFVAQVLFSSIQSLNELLLDRNRLVEDWKSNRPTDLLQAYLGLPQQSSVDNRYKSCMEGMYLQTDNVIAFSTMVADALFEHGKSQRVRLRKRFHIDGPLLHKFDFSRFEEFLPPPEEFNNFAKMFEADKRLPVTKQALHRRLWRKLRRAQIPEGG